MNWLKQNGTAVLLVGGVLAYAGFVGTTGKCPSCLFLPKPDSVAANPGVSRPTDAAAQKTMPDLNLKLLDGTPLRAADLAGKVVLVDFWATWCPPCRQMIPGLVALQNTYRERGFVVVGLSADDSSVPVEKFIQKQGINYSVAMADAATAQSFGDIQYLPTSFLIDRAGRIVAEHTGYVSKGELEKQIKPLLEQSAPPIAQASSAELEAAK